MGLRDTIETVFKDLVSKERYEKITVTMICREAHISRSSFYVAFDSKEDIICSLFAKHALGATQQLNSTFDMDSLRGMDRMITVKMYEEMYRERAYYHDLYHSLGPDSIVFIRCATRVIEAFNRDTIIGMLNIDEQWQRDYVAYYFASSQATLMQKWIREGMQLAPEDIGKLYYSITANFWHNIHERGLQLEV